MISPCWFQYQPSLTLACYPGRACYPMALFISLVAPWFLIHAASVLRCAQLHGMSLRYTCFSGRVPSNSYNHVQLTISHDECKRVNWDHKILQICLSRRWEWGLCFIYLGTDRSVPYNALIQWHSNSRACPNNSELRNSKGRLFSAASECLSLLRVCFHWWATHWVSELESSLHPPPPPYKLAANYTAQNLRQCYGSAIQTVL